MSILLGARELAPVASQLPVSWYFDPVIHERELEVFFKRGPGYVGHELMAPRAGDFRALEMTGGAWALVNNGAHIDLVSNICRHRQAVILKGSGHLQSGNIVCPIHRWTYDGEGKLLGAPHFPRQPCLDLPRKQLQKWNGLLFQGPRDIAADLGRLGCVRDLDFSGHVLNKVEVTEYNFNWKTFIEVYLEDYHVEPFHPGLGRFVDCDQLAWEFGEWYSVQTVGVNKSLSRPGSEVYKRWHEMVLSYRNGEAPAYGAIWLTYYPNIMVEWYPGTLVVSTIIPRGADACTNIMEFYYLEDIVLFEREFVEAEKAAYRETAQEDDIICLKMQQGRKSLYQRGIEEAGPYQSPTEDGLLHFHEFLRRQLDPHLK